MAVPWAYTSPLALGQKPQPPGKRFNAHKMISLHCKILRPAMSLLGRCCRKSPFRKGHWHRLEWLHAPDAIVRAAIWTCVLGRFMFGGPASLDFAQWRRDETRLGRRKALGASSARSHGGF